MPIRIPDALPAHEILESENIFVIDRVSCDASEYQTIESADFESDADQDLSR